MYTLPVMPSAPRYHRPGSNDDPAFLHFDPEVRPSRGPPPNNDRLMLSDSMATLSSSNTAVADVHGGADPSPAPAPATSDVATPVPWRSGFLRSFPIWAIFSILLSLCCTGLALFTILRVKGQSVSSYTNSSLQPSVILAYTSTVANTALSFAMAEAVNIHYWTRALDGTQLVNLHYHWLAGQGPLGGLKSLAKGKAVLLSTVCLAVAITALLRGPLIQRVLDIQSIVVPISGHINAPIAQTMKLYFAIIDHSNLVSPSDNFTAVTSDMQQGAPMVFDNTTQPCSNCSLNAVEAVGFNISCNQTLTPYNMTRLAKGAGTGSVNLTTLSIDISSISVEDVWGLRLNVTRRPSLNVSGNIVTDLCFLGLSRMRFKVFVQGRNISFQSSSYKDDVALEGLNPTNWDGSETTAGLAKYGTMVYGTKGSSAFAFPYSVSECRGPLCFTYLLGRKYIALGSNSNDPTRWIIGDAFNSPTNDILNSFRQLAFRLALDYGSRNALHQNLSYTSERSDVIYAINHGALVPALIVSVVGALAVLPLLLSWWTLGRETSMSPLELAVSFRTLTRNGVALENTAANLDAHKLAQLLDGGEEKGVMVQYGVTEKDGLLGMWENDKDDCLRRPIKGELL